MNWKFIVKCAIALIAIGVIGIVAYTAVLLFGFASIDPSIIKQAIH